MMIVFSGLLMVLAVVLIGIAFVALIVAAFARNGHVAKVGGLLGLGGVVLFLITPFLLFV